MASSCQSGTSFSFFVLFFGTFSGRSYAVTCVIVSQCLLIYMCVDVNHYLCFREWWESYEAFGLFELVGFGLGWVNLNKLKKQIDRCRKRQKTEWLSSSQSSDVGSAKSLRHILFYLCCWMETDVQQSYLRSSYLWSWRMSFFLLLVYLEFITWGSVLLFLLHLWWEHILVLCGIKPTT